MRQTGFNQYKKFIVLVAIALFTTVTTASELSITPSHINFDMGKGEEECRNITVISDSYQGRLEGEVLWAEKGSNSTSLKDHSFNSTEAGIELSTERVVENFTGKKEIMICVKTDLEQYRHGAVYYKAVSGSGNIGVGIGSWIEVDTREKASETPTGLFLSKSSLKGVFFVFVFLAVGLTGFIIGRGGND